MLAGEESDVALGAMRNGARRRMVEPGGDMGGGLGEARGGAKIDAGEMNDFLIESVDERGREVGVMRGEDGVAGLVFRLLSERG